MKRRMFLSYCAVPIVAGCGGGNDSNAAVRLVNATVGVGALDFYTGDDKRATAVATDAASAYASFGEGTYDTKVKKTGSDSVLLTNSISYVKDKYYSVVAWGRDGAVKMTSLDDNADDPASGIAQVRLFNAAPDVGSVDLYLTDSTTSLDASTTTASGVSLGSLSNYAELGKGSYRLRVVGSGDTTDLRLDVPSITLADKDRVTVILQPTVGGVLANVLTIVQRGSVVTAFKNTSARARLVASVSGNGVTSAMVGSTSLSDALTSPAIGPYILVPSGAQTLLAQVNGATVSSATTDITAGADYTVLVYGDSALAQMTLVSDDNRLPTTSTKAKIRLIHGAAGYNSLSLTVDSIAVSTEIPYGTASPFSLLNTNSGNALVEVSSPLSNTPLFTTARASGNTGVSIDAQGVYSMFMLSGNSSPRGVLRKER
jgi:Domain of unknown function (DUF4397)